MPNTKNAIIRYQALDRCFSNTGRRFDLTALLEACNQALVEYDPTSDGIRRRQLYEDIRFMESSQGYEIDLEKTKEGRRVFYRYTDSSYSINKKPMNELEAEQLKSAMMVLTRFKGMPQFEWIEEIQIRLEDTFKLKGNTVSIVGFEQNPYLKGLNHFTELFNAIQNQQALIVEYQGFKQKEPSSIVFHPWYLKQYNNRWFLFGYNDAYKALSNLAIDRIISIANSRENYIQNKDIDFDDFFEDIVGVSQNPALSTEKLLIKISNEGWPYIESKPIHGSQKIKNKTDEYTEIELDVQVNHELIALLFSYMDAFEILEPAALREKFKTISESIFKQYK